MVSTKRRHRPQRGAHALLRASTIDDVEISDANTSVCPVAVMSYVIAILHVMVSSQDHVGLVFLATSTSMDESRRPLRYSVFYCNVSNIAVIQLGLLYT
jgi:hypothetical protein